MWSRRLVSLKKSNLLQRELVGRKVKVLKSSDSTLEGKEGVVVDETRNTLKLEEDRSLKVLPKEIISLSIRLSGGENVKVDGRKLVVRPEDRIKKFA